MALDVCSTSTSLTPLQILPQVMISLGVMIAFKLLKSRSSPPYTCLDASKAGVASAKHGIIGFSI
jgi:hypothetical protein